MDRKEFVDISTRALERIERGVAALEHDELDVQLAADVLTIAFGDGTRYVINAHSAAGQIWMAADKHAWHFDPDTLRDRWVAAKGGDELMATVARTVGAKLGLEIEL
jgi:CyaY protein